MLLTMVKFVLTQVGPVGTHATGAAGVISADRNDIGFEGIVPNSLYIARTLFFTNEQARLDQQQLARSLQWCTQNLRRGDVILTLIAISNGSGEGSTVGPIEWAPEYFDVIKAATDKGIIVVQAAGNEGRSLDSPGEFIIHPQ